MKFNRYYDDNYTNRSSMGRQRKVTSYKGYKRTNLFANQNNNNSNLRENIIIIIQLIIIIIIIGIIIIIIIIHIPKIIRENIKDTVVLIKIMILKIL